MTSLASLELVCFGPPTVRIGGGDPPAEVVWRKHVALLVYLALSPGRARTRDHLLGLFWPEKRQAQARHSLNEALRRLRKALGEARLASRGDAVVLHDAGLTVDALQFETDLPRDPARALELVRGDFLEGLALDDASGFEEWLAAERERWRTRAAGALMAMGEQALASSGFTAAQEAARRALAIQPFAEPAARLRMRAAALAGDPAGALSAFHDFGARLTREIGEQPGKELTALADRIRQGSWRPGGRTEPDDEPPLVGREAAHQRAFAVVSAGLVDGPQVLVVTGANGMGRTRLLAECQARAALEGAIVASARPLETDHDAPWSTLRMLFRSGLHQAPGLMGADPEAVGLLASLVPELATRVSPREPRDAAHVAAALAHALAAVAEEQPVTLAIDDAHLADNATLEALAAALRLVADAPVLGLVSAADPTDAPPRGLVRLRGEVGRGLKGASVRLDGLTESDLRQLTAGLAHWCETDEQVNRLTRRLTQETGGNPFYAVSLLRGFQRMATLREDFVTWPHPHHTRETPLPFSLPDLTRTAVAARVAELDPAAQRVLGAASVLGAALDPELIAAVTETARPTVEEHLAAAERRHLVRFDGARYAFTAGIIEEVIRRECVTPGLRARFQQGALAALAGRSDTESAVLRVELTARVEPGPAAFDGAVAVARSALDAASHRTARRAVAAAARAAGDAPSPEQHQTLAGLRARMAELEG